MKGGLANLVTHIGFKRRQPRREPWLALYVQGARAEILGDGSEVMRGVSAAAANDYLGRCPAHHQQVRPMEAICVERCVGLRDMALCYFCLYVGKGLLAHPPSRRELVSGHLILYWFLFQLISEMGLCAVQNEQFR